MKRVLFISCWCRKRPTYQSSPVDNDGGVFPAAISSSFSSPPTLPASVPAPIRTIRNQKFSGRRHDRKPKVTHKVNGIKNDLSSTIPIRGMETPKAPRMATSAPSAFTSSPQAALAKMTAGGFKPRQTPARVLLNAAAASGTSGSGNRPAVDLSTSPTTSTTSFLDDRVRKERSLSATPTPTFASGGPSTQAKRPKP